MNTPNPNTLANVARTLQNGAPPNPLTALPVPSAFDISKAPWLKENTMNLKTMAALFQPAAFTGNIEDWHLLNVDAFEEAAREQAEALKMKLPATPFDVDTSTWGMSNITEESLAAARKQLGIVPPSDDSPAGP